MGAYCLVGSVIIGLAVLLAVVGGYSLCRWMWNVEFPFGHWHRLSHTMVLACAGSPSPCPALCKENMAHSIRIQGAAALQRG